MMENITKSDVKEKIDKFIKCPLRDIKCINLILKRIRSIASLILILQCVCIILHFYSVSITQKRSDLSIYKVNCINIVCQCEVLLIDLFKSSFATSTHNRIDTVKYVHRLIYIYTSQVKPSNSIPVNGIIL